jgi:beta-glucanase (GH16 family)
MISKLLFQKKLIVGILFVLMISCSGNDNGDDPYVPPIEPTVIIPSNLSLEITIVGKDASNPNGDGSGKIQCVITATNAVKYGFRFGSGTKIENTTGIMENTFTEKGTNTYTVYAFAYSSTGHAVNTSKEITVYVENGAFSNLIFSDEFDTTGSPNTNKWTYDIGASGWGNNESQYYTSRTDNVVIANGILKIIAKKESYQGAEYTSTRMKTQGKFDFKEGKVEVRAKLPQGGGTWPAIWMLGSNISTVGWPACGEVDIMEHAGNRQGIVQSAMHTPSSFGNTINVGSQTLADVSTAFHVYAVEWTSEKMVFSVDGVVHYTYNPSTKNSSTWPFDVNQFLILNVAMGGTFGGAIASNFTESSMEIDYVRVYQ